MEDFALSGDFEQAKQDLPQFEGVMNRTMALLNYYKEGRNQARTELIETQAQLTESQTQITNLQARIAELERQLNEKNQPEGK
jgi:uncharacterized coiled-coil DUF342 family protein